MSRNLYNTNTLLGTGLSALSPCSERKMELPTVDRSPSRNYPGSNNNNRAVNSRNSPSKRNLRNVSNSPSNEYSSYYLQDKDLPSPILLDDRDRSLLSTGSMHRSRSATRTYPAERGLTTKYQSLDRGGDRGILGDAIQNEKEYMRQNRDKSRDRTNEMNLYNDDIYRQTSRQSPGAANYYPAGQLRDTSTSGTYLGQLQNTNSDLHKELTTLKKELELTNQKLGSSMHSIKTFWSPELKKERALRKEESAKYNLINDQLKLLHSENQVIFYYL